MSADAGSGLSGERRQIEQAYLISFLGLSFLLNIVLTWRLVWYLRINHTGVKSTDNLINRIVSFSVNTGMSSLILTLAPMILLALPMRNGLAWYPVMTLLAPVHTSIVLVAVNSRRSLVDRGSEGIELRSFDLDVAPRRPELNSTIEFAEMGGGTSTTIEIRDAPVIRVDLEEQPPHEGSPKDRRDDK
ncbi:hypothetical protein BD309DRAFT_870044 [Dichomitus squalens]|uniref:DUF6534 domain-containing protein n=1 Tax=Dichomitus squalens TaxID=114155 RepID=A0A4Q9NJ93_9APHY|nr:hypothetical protein BD309DRAFT_870044 [Dichomitus squalens]TBU53771.1 hypothetical protein BD310DRAFT_829393 [Dichomitus squalens]